MSTLAVMAGFASHRRHNYGSGLIATGVVANFRIARYPLHGKDSSQFFLLESDNMTT